MVDGDMDIPISLTIFATITRIRRWHSSDDICFLALIRMFA